MNVGLGGDHAGFELKERLRRRLEQRGLQIQDFGPFSADSVDYPDFVHPVANSVLSGENDIGILMCGSGNGVAMTANKHKGIRAALCWTEELGALARQHNNANILCLPARFIDPNLAEKIVDAFIAAKFEGGRHEKRVTKIDC